MAIEGETYEYTEMYPQFRHLAEQEGNHAAVSGDGRADRRIEGTRRTLPGDAGQGRQALRRTGQGRRAPRQSVPRRRCAQSRRLINQQRRIEHEKLAMHRLRLHLRRSRRRCPKHGITAGTRWEDIPADWACPDCGVAKADFEMVLLARNGPQRRPSRAVKGGSPARLPATISHGTFMNPIVIIGSGLAGYNVARELRKLDKQTPLAIITADSGAVLFQADAVERARHRESAGGHPDSIPPEQMAQQLDATVRAHTRVTRNRRRRSTQLRIGDETVTYSKLVLALGADQIRLPLSGDARPKRDDGQRSRRLRALSRRDRRQEARRHHRRRPDRLRIRQRPRRARLCGRRDRHRRATAGAPAAARRRRAAASDKLAALGVTWHLGTSVAAVDSDGGGVRITLADGATLATDVVLSAIGLKPRTALARAAGLKINRGIVVDRNLATSAPDVLCARRLRRSRRPGAAVRDADHACGARAGGNACRKTDRRVLPGDAGAGENARVPDHRRAAGDRRRRKMAGSKPTTDSVKSLFVDASENCSASR